MLSARGLPLRPDLSVLSGVSCECTRFGVLAIPDGEVKGLSRGVNGAYDGGEKQWSLGFGNREGVELTDLFNACCTSAEM